MPSRKLPNSDSARLSALMAAKAKLDADQAAPGSSPEVPLSRATIRRLETVLPQWEQLVGERSDLLVRQNAASSTLQKEADELRLMVSHYIQVMNFAIDRGIAPIGMRASCGLDLNKKAVPRLRSYQDVAFWAKKITRHLTTQGEGDFENVNPSAQDVADKLGVFETVRASLKPAKTLYDTKQEEVESMRPEIEDLIRDIWDEIDFYYRKRPISSIRRRAREFGVTYVGLEDEVIEAPIVPDLPGDFPGDLPGGLMGDESVDEAPVDEAPLIDDETPSDTDQMEEPALIAA